MSNIKTMAMGVATNDIIARIEKNMAAADTYEAKAVSSRLCAAVDLFDAFVTGNIKMGKQAFVGPADWVSREVLNDAKNAFFVAIKADKKSEEEKINKRKGNALWTQQVENEYDNERKKAERTFNAMVAMAKLAKIYGINPVCLPNEGKASIPAAYYLPYGVEASVEDHNRVLGDNSPYKALLDPTKTRKREVIFYLTHDGVKDYDKALAAWEEAVKNKTAEEKAKDKTKPQGETFASVTHGSVTATGLVDALNNYSATKKAAEAKAAATKAAADSLAGASTLLGGATDVPSTTPEGATVAGAETQPGADSIMGAASQPGADSVQGGADSVQGEAANRAPQHQTGAAFHAVENASTVLMTKIGGSDHAWKPSKDEAEALANLAAHIWLNPHVRAIFVAEQIKAAKVEEAEKRDSKPGKAS